MPRVPVLKPREVVRAFKRLGWKKREGKRGRGSHVILTKPGHIATLSVPDHPGKDVKRGTLRDLIHDAAITVDEFLEAARK